MIYRNQKEFEHIIQQLNNIQDIIQKKILNKTQLHFRFTSEHPIIDFFRSLGYNITPTISGVPDEIGYTQDHESIGFESIKSPKQLVPHWSLEQAIQQSQYHGNITRSIIVTNGTFSQKDRRWTSKTFANVKLFDTHDLHQLSYRASKSKNQSVQNSDDHQSYSEQKQLLQKLKQQIVHKQNQQKLDQQRAKQLKRVIQQIQNFIPMLTKFKNDFKKSAHQQDNFVHRLQQELNRQQHRQAKLQTKQRDHNFHARLKAAQSFSNEIINLI